MMGGEPACATKLVSPERADQKTPRGHEAVDDGRWRAHPTMLLSANTTAISPIPRRTRLRGAVLNTIIPPTMPIARPVSRIGMLRRS